VAICTSHSFPALSPFTTLGMTENATGAVLAAVAEGITITPSEAVVRSEAGYWCEPLKGAVNKAKGAVKDAVGKLTRSKKTQAEGKADKAKGTAQRAAGDVKDTARNATR
jgi:uncharacterized protein YjbJ (UPF0337 family)